MNGHPVCFIGPSTRVAPILSPPALEAAFAAIERDRRAWAVRALYRVHHRAALRGLAWGGALWLAAAGLLGTAVYLYVAARGAGGAP